MTIWQGQPMMLILKYSGLFVTSIPRRLQHFSYDMIVTRMPLFLIQISASYRKDANIVIPLYFPLLSFELVSA
jgi:hypothetical protein